MTRSNSRRLFSKPSRGSLSAHRRIPRGIADDAQAFIVHDSASFRHAPCMTLVVLDLVLAHGLTFRIWRLRHFHAFNAAARRSPTDGDAARYPARSLPAKSSLAAPTSPSSGCNSYGSSLTLLRCCIVARYSQRAMDNVQRRNNWAACSDQTMNLADQRLAGFSLSSATPSARTSRVLRCCTIFTACRGERATADK